MEFNVKGITFTQDDLVTINLSDIEVNTISHAHYFHFLPGKSKAILLLRAGDYLDKEFVERFKKKGLASLYCLEVTSREEVQKYKTLWGQFKVQRTQKQKLLFRDVILKKVAEDFLILEEKSFLSFVIACFEEFNIYSQDFIYNFQDGSLILYNRALLVSALNSLVCLATDYTDYLFIKDFYNLAFGMDSGFILKEAPNFMLISACEAERKYPGSGQEYLEKNKRSEFEIKKFLNHPLTSFELVSEFKEKFIFPELIEHIKIHHEKRDGTGFPYGLYYSSLSDTETLLSFCDYFVPFEEHHFHKGDGRLLLDKNFQSFTQSSFFSSLPVQHFSSSWQGVLNWSYLSQKAVSE